MIVYQCSPCYSLRPPESKKRKAKAASTIEDRERISRKRLLPRFGETEALKIKPSESKGWLESVQDEGDLENSTMRNPPFIVTGPPPQPRFRPVYS